MYFSAKAVNSSFDICPLLKALHRYYARGVRFLSNEFYKFYRPQGQVPWLVSDNIGIIAFSVWPIYHVFAFFTHKFCDFIKTFSGNLEKLWTGIAKTFLRCTGSPDLP